MKILLIAEACSYAPFSMIRFHHDLQQGLAQKGHQVDSWKMPSLMRRLAGKKQPVNRFYRYLDHYLLTPLVLLWLCLTRSRGTLFVVVDNNVCALPCWLFWRKHAVVIQDVMATHASIKGSDYVEISRLQRSHFRLIRFSLRAAKNFIVTSRAVEQEFLELLPASAGKISLCPLGYSSSLEKLGGGVSKPLNTLPKRYLLHIGGNTWYKNRSGVIRIYQAYREISKNSIALVLIGEQPDPPLIHLIENSPYRDDIHVVTTIRTDQELMADYQHAEAFIFPSVAEGFGYPIIECQLAGTPVFTTRREPTLTIGGSLAACLPLMPPHTRDQPAWAQECAKRIDTALNDPADITHRLEQAQSHLKQYTPDQMLGHFEQALERILS